MTFLNLPINLFFYKYFYNSFFFFLIHIYIYNINIKYYQENKERLQKKVVEDIKLYLKKKTKKSDNIVMNITKISQKMKKNKLVEYRKKCNIKKKRFISNYKKVF